MTVEGRVVHKISEATVRLEDDDEQLDRVRFGERVAEKVVVEKLVVEISDKNFEAQFDDQKWTVAWKWRRDTSAAQQGRSAFDEELKKRK